MGEAEGMQRWTDGLKRGDHCVHFYRSEAELGRVLGDLLEWTGKDEKVLYASDRFPFGGDMTSRMVRGPQVESALRSGRLEFIPSCSFYCPGGKFDALRVIGYWKSHYDRVMGEGFGALTVIGDASWLSSNPSTLAPFVSYEQALDLAGLPENLSVICQYDRRIFIPGQLAQMESAHQLVLSNGALQRKHWIISHSIPQSGLFFPGIVGSNSGSVSSK